MVDGKYEASIPFLLEYFKNGKVNADIAFFPVFYVLHSSTQKRLPRK